MMKKRWLVLLLILSILTGLCVPVNAKTTLNLISGKVLDSGTLGNANVYSTYMETTITSLNDTATYSFADNTGLSQTVNLNDGRTWTPVDSTGQFLTNESIDYVVTFDLKDVFDITRVDVHEGYFTKYNYLAAISDIAVGKNLQELTSVEFSAENITESYYKAHCMTLSEAVEGRYVQITLDVGNDAYISEIMIFGNEVEKNAELKVLSQNAFTDNDRAWYAEQKIDLVDINTDVSYFWTADSNNAIVLGDSDYNNDGIRGENNICDGNITLADNQYTVSGTGEATVVFDFGKKYSVNRVDVHEFVKAATGIGRIMVYTGNKLGELALSKTHTLNFEDCKEFEHRANVIDFATVEAQYVAVRMLLSDGLDTTADSTSCKIAEIVVSGVEYDEPEFADIGILSAQSKIPPEYEAYNENATIINTGATYSYVTADEYPGITVVPTYKNLTAGELYLGHTGWHKNQTIGVTFDLNAPRCIDRIDVCYQEDAYCGWDKITIYGADSKENLYSDVNIKQVFDMSRAENRNYQQVAQSTVLGRLPLENSFENRYVGIILTNAETSIDSDNESTLRQIVIIGSDGKFSGLIESINNALKYDNPIPYEPAAWERLQEAIEKGNMLLRDDSATAENIEKTMQNIDDAVYNLCLRGGQQILSQNTMIHGDWKFYPERWPEIIMANLEKATVRFMTAEDGVTNVDKAITHTTDSNGNITGTKAPTELLDGGPIMYSGQDGIWSVWGGKGTTYVLFDFGESCWINGADIVTNDIRSIFASGTNKHIGKLKVEVSEDGKTFVDAGFAVPKRVTEKTDFNKNINVYTRTVFPAVRGKYAKVSVEAASDAIQNVLMEMHILGTTDFTNEIKMTKDDENLVTANVVLDGVEENVVMFVATYDRFGNLADVVKQNGDDITLSTTITDGQSVKAMVFDSLTNIRPLFPANEVVAYTDTEFTLSGVFSDNGVLQRGIKVPIYGTATTGAEVTVTIADKEYKTKADGNGDWKILADEVIVGNSYDIVATDGVTTFTAKDMLAGDVWVCSGQSNMEYEFFKLGNEELPTDTYKNYKNFRFLHMPYVPASNIPLKNVDKDWQIVSELTEEELTELSCLATFCGMKLSDYLGGDIPVGIISAARGNSYIEGFISQEGLKNGIVNRYWNSNEKSTLYNRMISPIINYGIKGVFWYQGCNNAGTMEDGAYLKLQKALVNDWRTKWGNPELPFIVTQLSTNTGAQFMKVRDAQVALRDEMNKVAVITTMDLGDATDADGNAFGFDIHPREKKAVAERLVRAAAAIAYGDTEVEYLFPVMKSVTLKEDGSVDVVFDDVYDGLEIMAGDTTVTAFKLELNGKQYNAKATITGKDTVNVKVDGILKPDAIAFAYEGAPNPEVNLFNSAGLSAAPFYAELN